MISLAEYLHPIRPDLAPGILSDRGLRAMTGLAALIPFAPIQEFGFECRLNDAVPRLDLGLSLGRPGGPELLGDRHPWIRFPSRWTRHPAWGGLSRFGRAWAGADALLEQTVRVVFLEFDLADGMGEPGVPSLFFNLEPAHPQPQAARDQVRVPTALRGLTALLERPAPPPQAGLVAACIAELPSVAKAAFLGLMLSRPDPTVRLCLSRLPEAAILPYLERIGWTGHRAGLAKLLALAGARADVFTLNLDLGPEGNLLPRAGIECFIRPWAWLASRGRWSDLVDTLRETGLCLAEKGDGVLAFGGLTPIHDPRLWPPDLALGGPSHPRFGLARSINHLKITIEAQGGLEAKAYVSVRPCRSPRPMAARASQLDA